MKRQIGGRALKLDRDIRNFFQPDARPSSQSDSIDFQADQQLIIQKGDIIIAGRNFGSIDETMPEALLSAGAACIIAISFSRPFYRNCINLGLPLIENGEAFGKISSGETVSIDFDRGEILCKKGILAFPPYPEIISKILFSGGLLPHTKRALGK
jgi:3-isopropylmalate dehydratase small subunit